MTTETKEAAVARWRASLTADRNKIIDTYSYASVFATPPTGADLYRDADRWWQIATKFQTASNEISNITSEQKREAEDNTIALLELRYYAKSLQPAAPLSEADRTKAVTALIAPIDWLLEVGSNVLAWNIKVDELVDDVKNAPSNALSWGLDQLFKSLHLPTWLIPVFAITLAGGALYLGYQTFIKPAGRAMRLLPSFKNPGKRRRKRRRRKMLVALS